jgi:uncharacterized protein
MTTRIRRALITGASSGIGLTFAERLAREGTTLTLVARSERKLEDLRTILGGDHRVLVADLAKPADVSRVADDVRSSGYDLLVNNAGAGSYGRFVDTPIDRQLEIMSVNMSAVVTLAHAFLEKARRGDALLNVGSTVGLLAFPGGPAWAASKAFVTSLSESLWAEMRDRSIYVAAILPGATRTSFHEACGGDPTRRPADHISQSPEQIVEAAMAALAERAEPTIVPGLANKAMVFSARFMPRRAMATMMGGLQSL